MYSGRKKYRRIARLRCSCDKELTKREQRLQEQLHFFQTLIDSTPSPMFYKDVQGVYIGCNKAFENYLGKLRSEIIGKSVYDLSPSDLAYKYFEMDRELFVNPGTQVYESNVVYADGSKHDVIFYKATYMNTYHEIAGLVGIIMDITARKDVERQLYETSMKLEQSLEQIVTAMSTMTETRDLYTAGHQERVSELAVSIAKEILLSKDQIESIKVAGLLHDIGKIAVPAEILVKPNKLSYHEFGIVKGHPEAGYEIVKQIQFPWPIAEIIYQHHERLDGSGYPRGLKHDEILLEAQVLAVADVVEAMSSHRPYRPSLGLDEAIMEIKSKSGILYNEDVVSACIRIFEKGNLHEVETEW